MIILRNNSHGELQEFVWEYLRPLYQEKLFLCTWKTSEWTTRSIGFFSSKLAKSDENGVYNLPIPPPHPPIPTSLPLSGYVRARYSLATLGFKCLKNQNKQVEKLKRGQKQRVNIIRVVNNEKIC